jgi:hypothetical protein
MVEHVLGHARRIEVASSTIGGATLRKLWDDGHARAEIHAHPWTHVVLQGQSVEPCTHRTEYVEYARRFEAEARAVGATVVLYGTWPRRVGDAFYSGGGVRSPSVMLGCLQAAWRDAMGQGVEVADVGVAWMHALAQRPGIVLYQGDGSHPTEAGTFLAAEVLASTLTGQKLPARWHPTGVSAADADFLAGLVPAASSPHDDSDGLSITIKH